MTKKDGGKILSNSHRINAISTSNDSKSSTMMTLEHNILKKELNFIRTLATSFGNTFRIATFSKSYINI